MKTKPFSELRKQMTPEQREESETYFQLALLHLALAQLQESLEVTPNDRSTNLDVIQSALSQMEEQDDIHISTLSRYINALGGSLKLVAQFPDEEKEIVLAQFE